MKYRDTDYVFGSALIRALENSLINYERLSRMAQAPNQNDALRILSECGYTELSDGIDACINAKRLEVFHTVEAACPANNITEFFRVRYYCNNIKAVIKGEYSDKPYEDLLIDVGGIDLGALIEFIRGGQQQENKIQKPQEEQLPEWVKKCAIQAKEKLEKSADGAETDLIVERAGFARRLEIAKDTASVFLTDYCRLLIDIANLKAAARLMMTERKDLCDIEPFIIDGGTVSVSDLSGCRDAYDFLALYKQRTALSDMADAALDAVSGRAGFFNITHLAERAESRFLASAKSITFGEQPIIAYIALREAEFIAVRAVMTSRAAGMSADSVLERLRWLYV